MTDGAKISAAALLGLCLAAASGLALILAGLGTRWALWDFRTGFAILRWSAYGGLAAAVLCVGGLIVSLGGKSVARILPAAIGLVIAVVTFGLPLMALEKARRVPAIDDITTDTENPPQFVAILPLRKDAPNPAQYGGPKIAAQQQKAYPDVKPLFIDLSAGASFDKALGCARTMGWKIVDAEKGEGRIEATDRTFWFGFTDDIVIRIIPNGAGSRIDVRSASRVGKSDLGVNAKRIRAFMRLMRR